MEESGCFMILDPRMKKTMARFSGLLLLAGLGLAAPQACQAQAGAWSFLPGGHLFAPPLADPREPQDSVLHRGDGNKYECSMGGALDLARFTSSEGSQWAWGAEGSAFLAITDYASKFLDQSFRLDDIDLGWGTYVSWLSGPLAGRLEYQRGSSHLGQFDFSALAPIAYQRDGLRLLASYQPFDSLRFYGGPGFWFSAVPRAPPLYAQAGTELFTNPTGLARGYFACDLKLGYESEGTLDAVFQAGVQWKGPGKGSPGFRLAVLYTDANNRYGQFSSQRDNHWSFGAFFDP